MLSTYSPQREGSGMMQLHSPTHDHKPQYDPQSAISEIQRSLSRSPSKPFNFRSTPTTANFIYTPSPLSPPRRTGSEHLLHFGSITSPHSTRSTQTGRIQRPVLRRTVQTVGVLRARTSPKSPSKRTFTETDDSTPQFQTLRKRRSTELEDDDVDPMDGVDKENIFKHNDDQITAWKTAQTKQEKRRSGGLLTDITPLSPMRRLDGMISNDPTPFSSPSAKRRSVQVQSGMDFSIFESDNLQDESQEKRSRDDHDWFRNIPMSPSTRYSTIPKRSSSLRKSTLQQRQSDKSSPLRLNSFAALRQNWLDGTPYQQKPIRSLLDSNLAHPQKDSPFATPGFLLNASIHPIKSSQETAKDEEQGRISEPSTTAPPSSCIAVIQDDSPTHEPIRRLANPSVHDFSRSLPIGAMRPPEIPQAGSQELSSQGSFATPAAYKAAKPLPAAFMSTGLISKKNRNIDEPDAGLPKAHMPDTPCKKQSLYAPMDEKFKPTNATIHNLRASVGTPKSPSEVPFGVTRVNPFPWAKSTSIFANRARHSLARKASFASIISLEVEDKTNSQSPSAQVETQSTEGDYPPTPTKHASLNEARGASVSPSPQHIVSKPFAPSSIQVSKLANISPHLSEALYSSPHTPLESVFPPDPSNLSISGKFDRPTTRQGADQFSAIPATPTGPREYFNNFSNRPSLNLGAADVADVDQSLTSKFDKVDLVGTGEFSQVYRVSGPPETSPFQKVFTNSRPSSRNSESPGKVWAVKKSRHPYSGPKDRARKVYEVDILKALGHNDHVISFVDSWEDRGHLYIQTEFCEEGTLDVFLAHSGSRARLDDFRIWKILLEVSLGIKHIHDMGFIHLDLKPANILITFEGVLKIGDFGLATKWPAKTGIDGEGDREYIGPEILMGRYDKPADVFALGLIMLETAGNVELPDNGASWQKLRSGDMSDVPSLTWSSESSNILRDASGNPLTDEEEGDSEVILSNDDSVIPESPASKITCMIRRGELVHPPSFMTNPSDEQSLDRIVRWMISPDPDERPLVDQVLQTKGVRWAESRRRAGATIFEGNWGPADEILAEDAEMIDV